MSETEGSLFRKSTLERVSSPDQLNEYIKVTNPSLIIMLIGVFSILIAGMVWIFAGVIPKSVAIQGVVATNLDGNERVYCYVPIGTSKRLSEGMEVQISPDYADREQFGYINGKIISIGSKIVTTEYLASNFAEPQVVYPVLSQAASGGNVVEVELSMGSWSSDSGKDIEVMEGTLCSVSAIVGGTRPYELIFNK